MAVGFSRSVTVQEHNCRGYVLNQEMSRSLVAFRGTHTVRVDHRSARAAGQQRCGCIFSARQRIWTDLTAHADV